MAQKIKCPSCGKYVKEGSSFCIFCSYQLGEITDDDVPVINENQNIQEDPPTVIQVASSISESSIEETTSSHIKMEEDEDDSENNEEEDADEEQEQEETESTNLEMDDDDEIPKESNSKDDDEADDDESFMEFMNEKNEEKTHKAERKSGNKVVKQNMSSTLSKLKNAKDAISSATIKPKKETQEKQKVDYDPNSDGYYDNLMAIVDAKIDHIPKENIIKTIATVIAFIIFVVGMIYFI